jgi:NAD(P)-dependent dehydrogenase (short-subunit alcohol dehydrogenase family)
VSGELKRYIITGASSGIGRAVAELAAEEGAELFLVDLNAEGLEEVQESLTASAAAVHIFAGDLAEPEVCQRVVDDAAELMGGIDVLVSNAGVPVPGSLLNLTVERFDLSIAVNARATWLLGKAGHPHLAKSGGNIVSTASICGHQPALPLAAYSAAKAASLMLTQQMALEWGPDGIRCNSVSPGPTVTGMTSGVFNDMEDEKQRKMRADREALIPLRKVGQAIDVARAIMFLASPLASQISGIDILVDGGTSTAYLPAVGAGRGQ